jgi:hypothetical protein
MAKQKHIFHAAKVDRIAIVDRPAVPDAEILVYKRADNDQVDEKGYDFNQQFNLASSQSAVQVLEAGFWNTFYDSELDQTGKTKQFKAVMKDFTKTIIGLAEAMVSATATKAEGPTAEEITQNFSRGLNVVAIYEGFNYFKSAVSGVLWNSQVYKNTSAILKGLAGTFEEFVIAHMNDLEQATKSITEEKIGRKISRTRMEKLRGALKVLSEIIDEVEVVEDKNTGKENTDMELKQLQDLIEKSLAPVREELNKFRLLLTEKGIIEKELSPEEKLAKEEAEKKAQVEAEEKAKKDAEAKAEAEKQQQEAEKQAKEAAEKRDKDFAELKESSEKAQKELAEMKAKSSVIEKALSSFEKRTGIRVSMDADEVATKKEGDPFADALKGGKK